MPSFESLRFGTLQYDPADVIELPEGLIGLPKLRRWLMLDMDQDLPMRWLQSLDRPEFGLPVMPPFFFADEYEIKASTSASRQLSTQGAPDLVTLIIATIHPGGEVITGNLRAPLILDAATRRGAQLALDDDRLSTRQEIDYLKFGLAVAVDSAENADQESAAGNPGSGTGETVVARDAAVAESVASGL
jgi:flagellar assembly factor FliW